MKPKAGANYFHRLFKVNSNGTIPDKTICPWCWQPKQPRDFTAPWTIDPGTDFEKKIRKTTTMCISCRRKKGLVRPY